MNVMHGEFKQAAQPTMKTTLFLLLTLSLNLAQAQMPAEIVIAQRSKLLTGVLSVPKPGAPGPVAIWGNMAFPILSAPDKEGVEIAVAAAAGYGKGRVILFGHNSFLDGGIGGDHAKLMENCVQWVGTKEKPRLGLVGVDAVSFYDLHGFQTKKSEGPLIAKTLKDYDVIIANIQGITDPAEGAALIQWIKEGGGFIGGMTGWAFNQTSGGKELSVSHGVNQALMAAGIAITDLSAFDQITAFTAKTTLPKLMNASEAVNSIKKQASGSATLTPDEIKQSSSAIQIALAAQPPDRSNLRDAVTAALGATDASGPLPTKEAPLTQAAHASARIRLGMETRVLRLATNEAVTAHPSHVAFPGQTPAEAPRITQEIPIHPAIPGWTSTGLYAAAGDTVTVTIPSSHADKGYAIRIGCHSDTLYHLDTWQRAPDITKSTPLTAAVTKTASAFGGLIYIEVPTRAAQTADMSVIIAGAVPSPLFILGKDDDAKWNNEIKKRPGIWAEMACENLIISFPTSVAKGVNNPTELMTFWQKVVAAQDDVSNQTAERKRPERIVADIQISAGYMHSGYPIMIPTSAAPEMVTYNRLKFPGWGFYHEIGHNHQRGDFTFNGTGEVTNNVIGMYCYHEVLKKDWLIGHPAISEEARKENLQKIKRAPIKWQAWKSDPFLALTTYIQLMQEFGWDSWRQYLHSFADSSYGPTPKGDDERRDQFLIRYSKITQKNLGPFFDAWGIPVSTQAKAQVSQLAPWMPKGM